MKFKNLKFSILFLAMVAIFISCEDDDEFTSVPFVPEDRTEQQVKDKGVLITYLSTHYYNSGDFQSSSNHKYTDIEIKELIEGASLPENHTLLIDAVETRFTTYNEADYEYYVLNLNQGGGKAPNFTDSVRVRYEGSSVNTEAGEDEDVFDSVITPIDLPLVGNGFTTSGTIRAWQLVLPMFNTAESFSFDNGSVNYGNYGLGVMFVPSGLSYFSGTQTGSSYDNLIFKFELLQYEEIDHDNDGIPSYVEDLNNNLDAGDDDTNENLFPDYVDQDDDGDEVLTLDELMTGEHIIDTNMGETLVLASNEYERSRTTNDGIVTVKTVIAVDSNNNGTPDYLEADISVNYNTSN